MICPKCNSEISDSNSKFCNICGAPLPAEEPVQPEQKIEEKPAEVLVKEPAKSEEPEAKSAEPDIPFEYKPISAWGYFGWNLLFGIPLVGFILLIIFSCGGTKNKNLKNYARSFWCGYLLILIIMIIALVISGGKVGNMRLF